ncbi:MAG: hypothetical protein E7Z92_03020 [Cyanobacteria bacterium SIG31]|nr:hypothetical protein [Cyanobacteria bacterium SIG31]
MSLFKNVFLFILSIQEKFLTQRLNKTLGIKNSSKRKKYYQSGCFLNLDSIADSEKIKMEEELQLILKACNYNPLEVLEYIKKHDTKVYYIDSQKAINSIGENEGFIYPQKGAKALYISLLVDKKFALKTPEMFILTKGEINKYYFIYHFYNWYAFKHNILGIDAEAQEMLNKYLYGASEEDFNKLQLADIYKLKDAIKQDKAAISFVFKLCQNYESSKKALEKLKDSSINL